MLCALTCAATLPSKSTVYVRRTAPASAANPVQQALLPVGGPPSESGTENSVSSSLPPVLPCLLPPLPMSLGSDRGYHVRQIVVKQRARWDYKTNMTLGACWEHTGRKTSIDEGDPVFVQD
ncbi:hypothetical protein B0H14DRAFT_2590546 [Mycena olivaceomarginata]|nr:hypothetical protein B0H14DRAFT_2590546 [Mycena olivaceomarginata]